MYSLLTEVMLSQMCTYVQSHNMYTMCTTFCVSNVLQSLENNFLKISNSGMLCYLVQLKDGT